LTFSFLIEVLCKSNDGKKIQANKCSTKVIKDIVAAMHTLKKRTSNNDFSKQMSDVGLQFKVYCDLQCDFCAIYIYIYIFKCCLISHAQQPQKQK